MSPRILLFVLLCFSASLSGTAASESVIPYGLAQPVKQVQVAPRAPGVLIEVLVSAGQFVKQGEVLGVIDNRVAEATVQAARAAAERTAEIEQSRRALEFAKRQHQRYRAVADDEAIATIELDNAAARVAEAEAVLQSALEKQLQARRNLQLEQARLESHNIRAPFSGQVIEVFAQRGAALPQQEALLTLVDTSQLEVELYLSATTVSRLRVGQTYRLQAKAPIDDEIDADLKFISPVIESGTGTFRTVFSIDNTRSRYPAGFAVFLNDSASQTP